MEFLRTFMFTNAHIFFSFLEYLHVFPFQQTERNSIPRNAIGKLQTLISFYKVPYASKNKFSFPVVEGKLKQ